jgi:hypothetical protein
MLKIVALTGSKGSGKDTVGQLIADMHGGQTIAFADPIKQTVMDIFKLKDIAQYDAFKRTVLEYRLDYLPQAIAGRHVVREIGMLMRNYDDKQFNQYVRSTIESQPDKLWVVTDLRFDNEYTMLRSIGAKVIKIIRPSYTYDGHITEREFNDSLVDHTLMNDGSLEYLKIRTELVMKNIMKEFE